MSAPRRHALVLGGTGVVGSAVVRALAERAVPVTFTFMNAADKAGALIEELQDIAPVTSAHADLTQADTIGQLFESLDARSIVPDVLVHCAALPANAPLLDLTAKDFDQAIALSGRCAVFAAKELASRLIRKRDETGGSVGHIVWVSALDRTQSLPLAPAFAAAQGLLAPLAMALAKELGRHRILVNVVAGGLIGGGVAQDIAPRRVADYEKFSALRRLGRPEEIAAAVVFLALDNEYMTGKTLSANGGI